MGRLGLGKEERDSKGPQVELKARLLEYMERSLYMYIGQETILAILLLILYDMTFFI